MTTINPTDIIYATLSVCGRAITNISISGVTSFADVLRMLHAHNPSYKGLATIDCRNSTQGWHQRRAVMLSRAMA